MDAITIYQDIRKRGMEIKGYEGNIFIQPSHNLTDQTRDQIRNMKSELLDFLEAFEERAAIMQYGAYDVHKTREEAEAAAFKDLTKGQTNE